MQLRYPGAEWRPLGPQQEPRIGVPRVFVVHTMVGYLRSTDTLFRREGYYGVESTFGIGGPWDGADLDGRVWQWQSLDHQADAQSAGNAYATSVETSDGGDALRPWSDKQLEALTRLGLWWCQQTGRPARLIPNLSGGQLAIGGFGYHRQFSAWNPNRHSCPGDTRLRQYLTLVIPEVARRLAGHVTTASFDETPATKINDIWEMEAFKMLTVSLRVKGAGYYTAAFDPTQGWVAQSVVGPFGELQDDLGGAANVPVIEIDDPDFVRKQFKIIPLPE